MVKDKAPSQDGFPMALFQTCWDVGKDVMLVFQELFSFHKFLKSLNATFIALISKIFKVFELKNFRPISLVRH